MDVLYEKNDAREAWNNKVLNDIAEAEKNCTEFTISCHQRDGVWGVWYQVGDEYLLVNPVDLVSSVFVNDNYCLLDIYNKNIDNQKHNGYFMVNIRCENHAFRWKLSHSRLTTSGTRYFTINEYLNKTKTVVDKLFEVWSNKEPVAYDDKSYVKLDAVELCKKQMEITAVMPSNYVLKNVSVQEEEFHFHPVYDGFNEDYVIGIGNREYKTTLTDWDNDLERIRHQLETYVYEREATLRLYFDMSDTVVVFKKESVLDQINEVGSGCNYKYKDYVLVEIHPNDFVNKPVIKGYCNEKEAIKTMYEGLLNHAMRLPLNPKDGLSKLAAYNQIKSPLIEAFLKDNIADENSYSLRQVIVKHVLTIEPDYMQLFHDEEMVAYEYLDDDVYDKEGKPFVIEGFSDWLEEIYPIVIDAAVNKEYEKDWADYHKRGLEFAQKMREKLSSDFDLWYDIPFEDKSGIIKKTRLIL